MSTLSPSSFLLLAAAGVPWLTGCAILQDEDSGEPSVTILAPADGDQLEVGEVVAFEAKVTDRNDPLVGVSVAITSDLDGELCKVAPGTTGFLVCDALLSAGQHEVTFRARDNADNIAEAMVTVTVVDVSEVDLDGDGYTEADGDCDDTDDQVFPGAVEVANGIDDDCDGDIDEDTSSEEDSDGDGYSEEGGDCDDTNPAISPAATELSNGVDDDCDGTIDELDGTYAGTLQVVVTGDTTGSCSGSLDLSLDSTVSPAITGTGDCMAGLFEAVSLEGELISASDATGTLSATLNGSEAVEIDWAGAFSGDALTASFSLVQSSEAAAGDTGSPDTGPVDTGPIDTGTAPDTGAPASTTTITGTFSVSR